MVLTHGKINLERQEKDLTFPCERLRSDVPVESYKVHNFRRAGGSYIYRCNFAADLVRKSAHMEKLE